MMMFWWLCSILLAQEVVANPQIKQDNLYRMWAHLSPEENLVQIHELQRSGRYEAAQQRLEYLLKHSNEPNIKYEYARNKELMEEYETALVLYEELRAGELTLELAREVGFRRAVVLSDMGRQQQSIAAFRKLKRAFSLSADEQIAVALGLGASEVLAGKTRRGSKRIQRSLHKLDTPRQHSWLQARARYTLAQALLSKALKIELHGPVEQMNEDLQARANLILQAEKQVTVILQLDEPEFALQGVLAVADALLILYDDLLSSTPPSSFTAGQASLYREKMAEKGSFLMRKAFSYYSKGLRYAEQLDWPGEARRELQRKRQALLAEL